MSSPSGKTRSDILIERASTKRIANYLTVALAIMLAASSPLHAQTPTVTPVPSQFAMAQTAFLGAAGAPSLSSRATLVSGMIYNSMYRALLAMNKYRLVTTPEGSDLSMEVSILVSVGSNNTAPFNSASLRLKIYDTRTHSLLWIIDEPVDGAFREKTFQKNIDDASLRIQTDLAALVTGAIPGESTSTPQTKTRLSQKG